MEKPFRIEFAVLSVQQVPSAARSFQLDLSQCFQSVIAVISFASFSLQLTIEKMHSSVNSAVRAQGRQRKANTVVTSRRVACRFRARPAGITTRLSADKPTLIAMLSTCYWITCKV